MKALVPSVLPHRELVEIILEYGMTLTCGDGIISEGFGGGVCWFWQVINVQKKQHRAKNGALWHA